LATARPSSSIKDAAVAVAAAAAVVVSLEKRETLLLPFDAEEEIGAKI